MSAGDLETTGYTTLQFSWGGLIGEPATSEPWSLTHLVRSTGHGTPGPTLCGIDRFATQTEDGEPVPGWAVGGGLSGPGVPVKRCEGCAGRRRSSLPVNGLNAGEFMQPMGLPT